METDQDPWLGQTLDRYEIVEHLGSGGMGRVYRARHNTLEREYAIKVLYGDLAVDDTFRTRFHREAETISRIRHPNVVSVSDFGISESGLSFIAMELLEGRTLRAALEAGPMRPTRAGRIAAQIARALGAAHQAGYVHRDVKPANVMLIGEPPEEIVKVLDFGSVSIRRQRHDDRLTVVGQIIGTPAYMAPEQFEDAAVVPSADLYSLGVVLYEMLGGRLPFSSARPTELMVQHLTKPAPELPECGGLERLVEHLLQKDPADRPLSADAVAAAIDALDLERVVIDGFLADTSQIPLPTAPTAPATPTGTNAPKPRPFSERPPIRAELPEVGTSTLPDEEYGDTQLSDAPVSFAEPETLVPEEEGVEPRGIRGTDTLTEEDEVAASGGADVGPAPEESSATRVLPKGSIRRRPPPERVPWVPMLLLAVSVVAIGLIALLLE